MTFAYKIGDILKIRNKSDNDTDDYQILAIYVSEQDHGYIVADFNSKGSILFKSADTFHASTMKIGWTPQYRAYRNYPNYVDKYKDKVLYLKNTRKETIIIEEQEIFQMYYESLNYM